MQKQNISLQEAVIPWLCVLVHFLVYLNYKIWKCCKHNIFIEVKSINFDLLDYINFNHYPANVENMVSS